MGALSVLSQRLDLFQHGVALVHRTIDNFATQHAQFSQDIKKLLKDYKQNHERPAKSIEEQLKDSKQNHEQPAKSIEVVSNPAPRLSTSHTGRPGTEATIEERIEAFDKIIDDGIAELRTGLGNLADTRTTS